ncbi:TetR/AcrR family transcriptional regulator [Mycolicibacterium austroafricanum]|jgi:AcrR family transcriptional regulator|uniref:TetR/AcrR family transcriptional regulator n=1 Tax=Mycolicibacterium austroafricanum TaxID=39687 RepID=UPI00055C6A15|nr:TetR/AcrR family transcriptional regulator [Mycolicibacterium austroafricanum]QZY45764.1 TetR family transcriptional regulator [Mycolicibacterium austroafricanum]
MAETMRRLPAQRRSRQTVQRILDAAENLLATVGYERAVESPMLLVEHAEVSKGAFYAYFTNPEMAMETLALSYMEKSTQMADEFAEDEYANWEEVARRAISVYSDYYRTPAVRELWLNGHLSPVAVAADERANLYIANKLWEAMRRVAPAETASTEVYHCSVAIEILDYLLRFAFRREPDGDPRLIREAAVAMVAYLRTTTTAG